MLAIPSEDLVRTIAAQGHLHLPAGPLGKEEGGEGAAVRERFAERRQQTRVGLGQVLPGEPERGVVAADVPGHLLGMGGFVVPGVLRVADAEGAQLRMGPGGKGADDAAVQTAAQVAPHRNVRDQAQSNGILEQVLQVGGRVWSGVRSHGGQVIPAFDGDPLRTHGHPVAGEQSPCPGQDGMGGGDVVEGEVLGERGPVHVRQGTQNLQGTQFAGEPERCSVVRPKQRFDAEPVAGQEQFAGLPVVDGQGEEAVQVMQEVGALQREQPEQHLRVRSRPEGVTGRFQPSTQLPVVEHLAIEDDGMASVLIGERLMPGIRGVDDAEATMAQNGPAGLVRPIIIRPPVCQPVQGGVHQHHIVPAGNGLRVVDACDAAHGPGTMNAERESR